MPGEAHILHLLPAYALGSLEEVEAEMVADHLASCADCRREFAAYRQVVGNLAYAAPAAEPSPALKAELFRRVHAAGAGAEQKHSSWRQWLAILQAATVGPIWRPAALLLIVALLIGNLLLWQRVNQIEALLPATFQTIQMAGTANAPAASGVIIMGEDGLHGTLVVQDLPALEETSQYQLWLIEDGSRTDGGTFSVGESGYHSHYISAPRPLSSYTAFGVTVEPAGGSPGPTGPRVLGNRP